MVAEERAYRCLRCGHEYAELYDVKWGPKELTCSRCRSNSVRRLPKAKGGGGEEGEEEGAPAVAPAAAPTAGGKGRAKKAAAEA